MDSMDKDPEVVIGEADGGYWLVNGEDHLDRMLEGPVGYPLPVGIIRFPSTRVMSQQLGPDLPMTSLWQVHPNIVARLRADGHVVEIVVEA